MRPGGGGSRLLARRRFSPAEWVMGPCGLVTCCPDGSPSNAMLARPVTGRALCEHVRPGRKTPDAGQEQPACRRAAVDIARQIGIDGGAWGTRVWARLRFQWVPAETGPGTAAA
jgi:hypothetical protein